MDQYIGRISHVIGIDTVVKEVGLRVSKIR
jgi:hypothetical protein